MSVNTFKYIHFAHYKDIPNWSVQYVVEEKLGFTKKYPMAKIGSFLSRSKELVTLQDDIVYKRVSVSTIGKGIAVRDTKLGKDIRTKKQYLVKKGQFLLSKIDARNGAFGVVPEEADGAIITGNFWAFDVDYNLLNPQYLVLVTQTKQFVGFAEKCSNGTTNRHYLQEVAFLQQSIPLPSLEEQERILADYNSSICKAEDKEKTIEENKYKIDKFILETLGVKSVSHKEEKKHTSLLSFVKLSSIERWDCYNERKLFRSL